MKRIKKGLRFESKTQLWCWTQREGPPTGRSLLGKAGGWQRTSTPMGAGAMRRVHGRADTEQRSTFHCEPCKEARQGHDAVLMLTLQARTALPAQPAPSPCAPYSRLLRSSCARPPRPLAHAWPPPHAQCSEPAPMRSAGSPGSPQRWPPSPLSGPPEGRPLSCTKSGHLLAVYP